MDKDLEKLKIETAKELGLENINDNPNIDPTSKLILENGGKYAGYVGGYMVRKMIQEAEENLANKKR